MPKFDKNNAEELKECLYNSCIHDSELENVDYEYGEDTIKIKLFNPIFNVKIDLILHNIEIALAMKGSTYGGRNTIISLTVEEDLSYLQAYLPKCSECIENAIYLLFQMLSGDELHIVSKEIIVRKTD